MLEAEPEPGGAVRSRARRRGRASSRPLQRVLSARDGLARPARARAGGARAALAPRTRSPSRTRPATAARRSSPRRRARPPRGLEACAPGDGEPGARLFAEWERLGAGAPADPADAVPAGPRRGAAAARAGPAEALLDFARFGVLPVRRLGEEEFRGDGAPRLLAGNALHAELQPGVAGQRDLRLVLAGIGQDVGFPVPEGGAGGSPTRSCARLEAEGGRVECGARGDARSSCAAAAPSRCGRRDGRERRASAARCSPTSARRSSTATCSAASTCRAGSRRALRALPVRRRAPSRSTGRWTGRSRGRTRRAAGGDRPRRRRASTGSPARWPRSRRGSCRPSRSCVVGPVRARRPARASRRATRRPGPTRTCPQRVRGDAGGEEIGGAWTERDAERFADRMEAQVERVAPGFRDRVLGRAVVAPPQLEATNANLVGGALNGGTAQLHQQLVFRPMPGLGRPETPVRRALPGVGVRPPGRRRARRVRAPTPRARRCASPGRCGGSARGRAPSCPAAGAPRLSRPC